MYKFGIAFTRLTERVFCSFVEFLSFTYTRIKVLSLKKEHPINYAPAGEESDMAKAIIAIEGSDGAGKETQAGLLMKFLQSQGYTVGTESFPRYNKSVGGIFLYDALKGPEKEKYAFSKLDPYDASKPYAMDRSESRGIIEDLVAKHDVVVFDRYVESNLLHQGGKLATPEERVEYANWLFREEYEGKRGIPRPDFVIYLKIPFWLSRARAERRSANGGPALDAVESDMDYVRKGHEGGIFYAEHFGWEVVEGLEDKRELTPDEVHQKVIRQITPRLLEKGIEI